MSSRVVTLIVDRVYRRGAANEWRAKHGFFIFLYVVYGFGYYFAEDSIWCLDILWLVPYGAAAVLCVVILGWVASFYQGEAQRAQPTAGDWRAQQEEVKKSAGACFAGVSLVFFITLAMQLVLLPVADRLSDSILWPLSFALLSSTVAGIGTYFYIGYPGMANLDAIDQSSRRQGSRPGSSLPAGLLESLRAEMDMLRSLTGSLVWLYGFVPIGTLFAFDEISVLFGQENSGDVPVEAKVWLIIGMALLLVGIHGQITGPVHGRYYEIARWLRWQGRS